VRFLLITLTVIAILGALFSGGCSLVAMFTAFGQYSGAVVTIASGVGLVAAAVLAANIWVLQAAYRPPSARRRLIAVVLACMDVAMGIATLWWVPGNEAFFWIALPGWSLLATVGAVALGVQGVLIGAMLGRGAASETRPVGEP
jgi:hypothetical protein